MSDSKLSRRTFLAMCGAGSATALAGCGGGDSDSRDFEAMDQLLADAVSRQDVPFAVATVTDKNGVLYEGSAGMASPTVKAGQDTICRLFSQSKGIGSLAAMILVDRGKLSLDMPVEAMLPEFAPIQVLDSLGPSGPVLRAPARAVTLRHLLTHTSGLAYNVWDSKDNDWEIATQKASQLGGTLAAFGRPLMFDPGDAWTYGVGVDWTGLLIQHVDGRSIDRFVQEEILDPLQMTDTVFEKDSIANRLSVVKLRGADGSFSDFDLSPPARPELYGMGQALYSSARDYTRFMRMLLNDGVLDGRRLASTQAISMMKTNQIGNVSVPLMKSVLPVLSNDVQLFPGVRTTHTIGFQRNEADIPGKRSAGSLTWAGALNTHYWIDPTSGVAAVLMTQALPFCDARFMDLYSAFEQGVYRALR